SPQSGQERHRRIGQSSLSKRSPVEQEFLESKLESALDDAWSKVNIALHKTSKSSADLAMGIWFAAEALEYSSLLFNLTYGLEDVKPTVKLRKGEEIGRASCRKEDRTE